ncbi:MAG: MscL family protein, partial [Candidatus Nanosalina sp.]
MGFGSEFLEFLKEYSVIGLAVAFVIGAAVKDLVSATVDSIFMPIVEVFLPAGSWRSATAEIMGVEFGVGQFLAAFLDFVIIALLVFWFVRYILRKEE